MSDDFTTRLGVQLREAARREERRGAMARTVRAARPRPAFAIGAFAAAAVAGVLLLATVFLGSPTPEPATPPGPPGRRGRRRRRGAGRRRAARVRVDVAERSVAR